MAWQNLGITHMAMSFKADTKPMIARIIVIAK